MATVRCPDCGQELRVLPTARAGDLVDCPNCAGFSLRLREEGGRWIVTTAHWASCPGCGETIVLPEGAKAGERVACCGQEYRLTFEYGAFALEET